MKAIAHLLMKLEDAAPPSDKERLIASTLRDLNGRDRDIAIFLLMGGKVPRLLTAQELKQGAVDGGFVASWLLEECYDFVGDIAETIGHIAHSEEESSDLSIQHWVDFLQGLSELDREERITRATLAWGELGLAEAILFNKLLLGTLRVNIPDGVMKRGVAQAVDLPYADVARALAGGLDIERTYFSDGSPQDSWAASRSKLAEERAWVPQFQNLCPLTQDPASLGEIENWAISQFYDGLRIQVVKESGHTAVWTEYLEIVSDRLPELGPYFVGIPDETILEGVLSLEKHGERVPSEFLSERLNKRVLSRKQKLEFQPQIVFHDLLRDGGDDLTCTPLRQRLEKLKTLAETTNLRMCELPAVQNWGDVSALHESSFRDHSAGVLLRNLDADNQSNDLNSQPSSILWAAEPFKVRAVLVYVKKAESAQSDSPMEYTFAVRNGAELIPFTRTSSGLSPQERGKVEAFARANTLERFGPVRMIVPKLVFELCFDSIQPSSRHKCGLTVRSPRVLRMCSDRETDKVHTLEALQTLLSD